MKIQLYEDHQKLMVMMTMMEVMMMMEAIMMTLVMTMMEVMKTMMILVMMIIPSSHYSRQAGPTDKAAHRQGGGNLCNILQYL